tara:strand:+ start:388 stop:1320 length:933 start_codon:yes stop_codon:yes gene_type:complete
MGTKKFAGLVILLVLLVVMCCQPQPVSIQEPFTSTSEDVSLAAQFLKNYKNALVEAFGKETYQTMIRLNTLQRQGKSLNSEDRALWAELVQFMHSVIDLNSASDPIPRIPHQTMKKSKGFKGSKGPKSQKPRKTDQELLNEPVSTDLLEEYHRRYGDLLKRNSHCKKHTVRTLKKRFEKYTGKCIPKNPYDLTQGDVYHLLDLVGTMAKCPDQILLLSQDYTERDVCRRPRVNNVATLDNEDQDSLNNRRKFDRNHPPVCIPQRKCATQPIYVGGSSGMGGAKLDESNDPILPKFSYEEHYGQEHYVPSS